MREEHNESDTEIAFGAALKKMHRSLRARQAKEVMPLIGKLLDEFDKLPNDISSDPDLRGLMNVICDIQIAMEGEEE